MIDMMKYCFKVSDIDGDIYYIKAKNINKVLCYRPQKSSYFAPVFLFRDPSVADKYIEKISEYSSERLNLNKDIGIEVCKFDGKSDIYTKYGIVVKTITHHANNYSMDIEIPLI